MPRVTIDTTEARSFEPTEPGNYEMTVESVGAPEKGDKSTYLPITYRFDDPAIDKRCGTVIRNYPISGKGAGFFTELWKALTGEKIDIGLQGFDVDTDDIVGKHVIAQIENREYDGRLMNDVKKVVAA